MKPSDFIKSSLITEARDMTPVLDRLQDIGTIRLLHAMVGLCTESGEFQDTIKKHIFYGKEIDKINLVEELGDLMWYMAVACDELGVSFEEVMEKNVAKLSARYKGKFSEEKADKRDLDTERKALEGESNE